MSTAYTQLVFPDLSATGRLGYCLEYAAHVFHCSGTAPYASTAWSQTQLKHTDPIPTDVAVPCWFSFYANGVNEGHVVASIPGQGFYSSPWKLGTDHAILPSIAEVERIYNAKYVGWSEDILGEQVIKQGEAPMTTQEATAVLDAFFGRFTGRKVKQSELDEYIPVLLSGYPDKFFAKAVDFDEVKALFGSQTVDKDIALKYVEDHLT